MLEYVARDGGLSKIGGCPEFENNSCRFGFF